MPRARSPERDLAYQLWLKSGKKRKLKDIAKELGVSEDLVSKWKRQDKWPEKPTNKNPTNPTDQSAKKRVKVAAKAAAKVVLSESKLTDKQQLFCIYFSKTLNATASYQKAYGCSYAVACGNGSALLKNMEIAAEIRRLKQERYMQAFLEPEDIFQKYMDIAFADMGDYLSWGQEEGPVYTADGRLIETTDPETGMTVPMTEMKNVVRLKESTDVDTTLIGEVKQGRDGVTIKLPDRMKALDWLASHMGFATPEQKAKTEKLMAETERLKNESEGSQDNAFLAAWKQSIIDGYKDNKDGEE